MIKIIALFIFLFKFLFSFSQDSIPVRVLNLHFTEERYNAVRFGIGIQSNFYTELGYANIIQRIGDTGFFSKGYYTAVEWTPKTNYKEVFAFKGGYEVATILGAIAIEAKYQFNKEESDFVLTPKIGINLAGDLFLAYGFNVSTKNYPFENISRHQLSLVFNLHKSYLHF